MMIISDNKNNDNDDKDDDDDDCNVCLSHSSMVGWVGEIKYGLIVATRGVFTG